MLSALGGFGLISWVRAVHGDRQRITPQHRRTFLSNLRRQGVISPRVGWAVLGYLRPGFHPDDTDTDAMVVEWRRRLEDRTTVIAGPSRLMNAMKLPPRPTTDRRGIRLVASLPEWGRGRPGGLGAGRYG